MAVMRLFAGAREAAGVARDEFDAETLEELLDAARARYGAQFSAVLDNCKVWVNGDETSPDAPLQPGDEVAVLPPVSGGATR